jgi:hypothetical protein
MSNCINCLEFNCVEFNFGMGICRDPECIFIHNLESPHICIICNKSLHPDIIHKYCGSKILANNKKAGLK